MRSIITCLGGPFLLLLLISHVLLPVGRALYYWPLAASLLMVTFLLMRLRFACILLNGYRVKGKAATKSKARKVQHAGMLKVLWRCRKRYARQTFKYSFWFTLSVLLSQVSMYVIYRLGGSISYSIGFWALTILCTAGVWISTHVVALRHRYYPRQAIVASLVAAGLLLFTADNFSSLSVNLMSRYGLGINQRVNMLLNEDGQIHVEKLGVTKYGDQLCNVEILSKVGDQYYLRVGDTAYVMLPKSDVVAIRPLN